MDELLYKALTNYYNSLSLFGYNKYNNVFNILITSYIYDLINTEYRYFITNDDKKLMQNILYQFIGSTAEIVFPTNCKCCCNGSVSNPSITGFSLVPNTTSYTGSQNISITGANFTIVKGTNIKTNSLKIYFGSDILAQDLSVDISTITFSSAITKAIVEGQSYIARASVLDNNNIEYFSNSFTIECISASVVNPSITNFSLTPSTTSYSGTQDVTFTGASFSITKGTNFKENSLEIIWGLSDSMGTGLSTSGSTITFGTAITKTLTAGSTYTARASVQDNNNVKYYSNVFTIVVTTPVTPVLMYTGNTAAKPTSTDVLAGTSYDYNSIKQFNTPAMMLASIWVCVPTTVTLVSMENANFSGDFLYNTATSKDLLTHEDITINGASYKLHYLTTIASHNPYKTIVQ